MEIGGDTFQCIQRYPSPYLTSDWARSLLNIIRLLWEGCQSSAQRACYLPRLCQYPVIPGSRGASRSKMPCSIKDTTRGPHRGIFGNSFVFFTLAITNLTYFWGIPNEKYNFLDSHVFFRGMHLIEECFFPKLTQSTSTHFEMITFLFSLVLLDSFLTVF